MQPLLATLWSSKWCLTRPSCTLCGTLQNRWKKSEPRQESKRWCRRQRCCHYNHLKQTTRHPRLSWVLCRETIIRAQARALQKINLSWYNRSRWHRLLPQRRGKRADLQQVIRDKKCLHYSWKRNYRQLRKKMMRTQWFLMPRKWSINLKMTQRMAQLSRLWWLTSILSRLISSWLQRSE